jgi:hypothetical protein
MHCQWLIESQGRWMKIFIVLSFVVFLIIFMEHIMHCFIKNNNKKYKTMSYENLKKLQSNGIINTNNQAVRLLINIMNHPIFHIM